MQPKQSYGAREQIYPEHLNGAMRNDELRDWLRKFVRVVFKRKFMILFVFAVVSGGVGYYTMTLPPIFKAESKIYLEREFDTEKRFLLGVDSRTMFERGWIDAEQEILKSHPLALRVTRALHLLERDTTTNHLPEDQKQAALNRIAESVRNGLKVASVGQGNVIAIGYLHNDPEFAAEMVNKTVEMYIQYRAEVSKNTERYKFYEKQLEAAEAQLRAFEKNQAQYKRDTRILDPKAQTTMLLNKLADYQRSLNEVRTLRIGKEAKLKIVQEQVSSGKAFSLPSTESEESPVRMSYISKLRASLRDMEMQRDELLQKFTPEYEKIVNLNALIATTKKNISEEVGQLVEGMESSIRALRAQEAALERSIRDIRSEIKRFTDEEYQLSLLGREIANKKQIYEIMLKQREEALLSLSKAEQDVKIKVISPAIPPVEPIKRKKFVNIILSLLLGLTVSLAMAFIAEFLDPTLKTPEEIERQTGLPVLAAVRESRNGHLRSMQNGTIQNGRLKKWEEAGHAEAGKRRN